MLPLFRSDKCSVIRVNVFSCSRSQNPTGETVWNVLNMCNVSHSTISEHTGLAVQNLKNVTLSGSVWRYDALIQMSAVKHEQAVHFESFLNGKLKLFRQGSMLITSELLNSKNPLL